MKVLGIDPGLAHTGWAVVQSENPQSFSLLDAGLLKTTPAQTLENRLKSIHTNLTQIIREHQPQTIALEEIFFMKAANSILGTSQARGVILLTAAQSGTTLSEYNPRHVKTALTGNGRAKKNQMQKMIQLLLKLSAPPQPDDVADAMAIALCHLRSTRYQKLRVVSCES
ncbi:MAG: crossover junction endodeoxyribonuclease RuvC [Elusimicrobia bacterium]|nr:crossover junction endodeoxyribonuclease RuvC [Elusimicrobiota bacterium]